MQDPWRLNLYCSDLPEILVLPGRLHLPNSRHQIRRYQHRRHLLSECLCAQDPCDKSNCYIKQVLKILQEVKTCYKTLQNKEIFYLATRGGCWLTLEIRLVTSQDLRISDG